MRIIIRLLAIAVVLAGASQIHAVPKSASGDSAERIKHLIASISVPDNVISNGNNNAGNNNNNTAFITESLQVTGCNDYPYHNNEQEKIAGIARLVKDLKAGLQQGLMCLTGNSPAGELHPYHHVQAMRLMYTLENSQPKSMQCVRDELFSYAMAASSQQKISDEALIKKLRDSAELTILLDTYRIGGLLSQKFEPETYQLFFKLDEEEITQHLTGKPMRMKGIQRYENLPGLLFHETVHWLGHLHTNINPDVTFLYETCCFGGSEYINDEQANAEFQTRACNILRDNELWSAHPYKKMRIWHHKEYDQLKREMRDYY